MNIREHVKRLTALSLTVAAVALLWQALSAGDSTPTILAQAANTPTPEAIAGSGDQPALPPIEGKLNPPQYPNMDSYLNRIVQQAQSGQFSARVAAANAPVYSGASVAVTLYITEGHAQDLWDWLEKSGASPRNIGADYIEAYIPVSLLVEACQRKVSSVSAPSSRLNLPKVQLSVRAWRRMGHPHGMLPASRVRE